MFCRDHVYRVKERIFYFVHWQRGSNVIHFDDDGSLWCGIERVYVIIFILLPDADVFSICF